MRKPVTYLAIIATWFAVGFCYPASAKTKVRIAFPTTATSLFLPYYVARSKGWLDSIDIEEVYVTGDSNDLRAVLSGNADFGAGIGSFAVLSSLGAGAQVVVVSSWQPVTDYSIVLRAGQGSGIADLRGKTIATSGPGALAYQLPQILLKKYGFDPSSAKFIQVGGHAARLQAVLGGRAEATMINTVTAQAALNDGKVTLVTKISKEFPHLNYVWNVVNKSALSDPAMKEAIQILTTAGIRGARFIMEHPDEAAKILQERVPDLDPATVKDVVADLNKDNVWGVDGGLNEQDINFTIQTALELGAVSKAVAPAQLTDPQFVNAAAK